MGAEWSGSEYPPFPCLGRSFFQKPSFHVELLIPLVLGSVLPHFLSCPAQHSLTHPELTVAVEMLSSVALINRALESGDMNTVWKQLSSSVTGLTNIEEENCQRWGPECVPRCMHGGYLCLLVYTPIFILGFMSPYCDFIMSVHYRHHDILVLLVLELESRPHTY